MLAPMMQQTLAHIQNSIAQNSPEILGWLHADLLQKCVAKHFVTNVNPIMVRACVLEMHMAKRNNLLEGQNPEDRFDFFVRTLAEPQNMDAFLNKYAALKTQIASVCEQFSQHITVLLQRLNKDKKSIQRHFLGLGGEQKIIDINATGDLHCKGQTVSILTFAKNGRETKVVYKPHTLKLDLAFQQFIVWFNQQNPRLSLRSIDIIAKKGYGWVEYIAHLSCKNEQEIQQFYTRLGYLLMMAYLFLGTDFHSENLIACGANPVLIDFECLLIPLYSFKEKPKRARLRFAVYKTLFLPAQTGMSKDNRGLDYSALGAEEGAEGLAQLIKWVDAGKDSMHAERIFTKVKGLLNKPSLDGKPVDYLDYEKDFLSGFREAFLIILQHKDLLLDRHSLLKAFKKVPLRLVLRATALYQYNLIESYHPKYLLSERARSRYFKIFDIKGKKNQSLKEALKAEINDLKENNVPFFSALSDGKKLFDSRGVALTSPIIKSGFCLMRDHLKQNIHEKNLKVQSLWITNSFSIARFNRDSNKPPALSMEMPPKPLSADALKQKALQFAKHYLDILAEWSYSDEEDIFWPSANSFGENKWFLQETRLELYNGLPGIALAYLYAREIFGIDVYGRIAKQCLNTIKKWAKAILTTESSLLGAYANGGMLYTLAAFYRVNPDKVLKSLIRKTVRRMATQIKKDKILNIQDGSAGSILLLRTLADVLDREEQMPLVHALARHIMRNYPEPSQLPLCTSPIAAPKPLLGFAQGVAGIALALFHYYLLSGNPQAKAWIEAAWVYVHREFDSKARRWPDFREAPESESNAAAAWCQGAAGIGMSALAMSKHWQSEEMLEDLAKALSITMEQGFGAYACLCHGNLGSLDFIQLAAPEKLPAYASMFVSSLDQMPLHCSGLCNSATPGLMTGMAGVSYGLMRIANPKRIPSILFFDIG